MRQNSFVVNNMINFYNNRKQQRLAYFNLNIDPKETAENNLKKNAESNY
jgi:hypothetical protein